MGQLLLSVAQAALQAFDLTKPTLAFGLQDAREEVVADLNEPRTLRRMNDEDGTTDTGLSELPAAET